MEEIDTIDQKLNAILGVEPDITIEENNVPEIYEPAEIEIIDNKNEIAISQNENMESTDFDEDFEFARNNMKEISKVGMNAIKELSYVARDSQTPRIYEVLSKMMKDVSDINATIIDNHSKKISQQPVEEASAVKVNSIENAVFCTSADMLKRIKQNQHK